MFRIEDRSRFDRLPCAAIVLAVGLLCGSYQASSQTASADDPASGEKPIIQAQGETPPKGLPPAPTYLPGTILKPGEAVQDESGAPGAAPVRSAEPQMGAADAVATKVAAAPAPGEQGKGVWQNLLPLLPKPGQFAVIPASELKSVLVRDGEFGFCEEIKCNRATAVIGAWNGGALDRGRGEFRVHGGGHADYGGNEVYVFNFSTLNWRRETDPQPLTGPFQRDTNGDGTADACPTPAAGPPATHTYQGFLYVPKIDRYWLFGTVGYCRDGMGSPTAWEYDAKSKAWTAMPELAQFAAFARAVIDPDSGNVVVHVGRKNGWREIDPSTRKVVRSFGDDPFGNYIDGPAVFDGRRHVIYTLVSGGKTDRLIAYEWPALGESGGFDGKLVTEWPKDGRKGWGMAEDASGQLVLWDGNTRIVAVNPDSGESREEETGGFRYVSMVGDDKAGKVYSKWFYIPEVDAFAGITNPDLGIALYRLSGAAASGSQPAPKGESGDSATGVDQTATAAKDKSHGTPPPVPAVAVSNQLAAATGGSGQAAPMEIEANGNWKEICAAAILCDPMGEGDVIYRGRVVESGPPQKGNKWRSIAQKNPNAVAPAPDPDIGGLRFTFPSNSGSGASGNFKTDFSPDYSFQIGPADAGAPAQSAYIQFQVRYSCTFIWTDCDPQSPNYRKERRCFTSERGDGKCTASKVALISTGDRQGFSADACTRIQIALNHGADHVLSAFHRCPRAEGFGEKLGRVSGQNQRNSQPNGAYDCPSVLNGGGKRGWNNTADSCFRLIDDRWITIQVHLQFGAWQGGEEQGDSKLSHVSIWAAVEGEDGDRQKLVIDNDFAATTPEKPNDFIGKIWLMPHLYQKSDKEDHPPFYVWYRNLVVSEGMIPNPK